MPTGLPKILLGWLLVLLCGCQGQPQQAADSTQNNATRLAQSTETQQEEEGRSAAYTPERMVFQPELLNRLEVPEGFQVNVFATGLEMPRMLATHPETGVIYTTQPRPGNVVALYDENNDGRADRQQVVVSNLPGVHGIAFRGNTIFLAVPTTVYKGQVQPNGMVTNLEVLMDGFPEHRTHSQRILALGPDDRLYLSIGSTCNACVEAHHLNATMVIMDHVTGEYHVFARGLRNAMGIDWHPQTRQMWATDHGSDWRGPNVPPEELNLLQPGGHYGWPWCYGKRVVDTNMGGNPEGTTKEEFCRRTVPSSFEYQAHSSPLSMVFYDGNQFPEAYRNDAFVTFAGSWNRFPPVGFKVVRIHFEGRQPVSAHDFLSGFLIKQDENRYSQFARVAGLTISQDGALLVSDYQNGVIYRVSYGP